MRPYAQNKKKEEAKEKKKKFCDTQKKDQYITSI